MKKVFLCLTAFMSMICLNANAQQDVRYGIKASGNMSNYILKKLPGIDSKMKFGASLGSFVNLEFTDYFSLQPEIGFHYANSEMKGHGEKIDIEYWGVEVPVYAITHCRWGFGKIYAGLGPYVGFGFSLKNTTDDVNLYKEDLMKKFDFGGAAMLGYEFNNGIQINAGYKMGILDLTDKADGKHRTQMFSLGVGYRF